MVSYTISPPTYTHMSEEGERERDIEKYNGNENNNLN